MVGGAHEGLVVHPVRVLRPVLVRGDHLGLLAAREVVHPHGHGHAHALAPQQLAPEQRPGAVGADLGGSPHLRLVGVVQQDRLLPVLGGHRQPPQLRALRALRQQGGDRGEHPRAVRGHGVLAQPTLGQLHPPHGRHGVDAARHGGGVQEPQRVLRSGEVVVPEAHGRAVVEDATDPRLVAAVVDLAVARELVLGTPCRGVQAGDEEQPVTAELEVRHPLRGVQDHACLAVLGEQPQPGALGVVTGHGPVRGEPHGARGRGADLLDSVVPVGELHRLTVTGHGPRVLHVALGVGGELLPQGHHGPRAVGGQTGEPRDGHELFGNRVTGSHVSYITDGLGHPGAVTGRRPRYRDPRIPTGRQQGVPA